MNPQSRDRPFPLDLVPRILPARSGRTIKRGLAQRIRALNHFVDDVYHGREIVRDGIVPWQLVVEPPALRARRARHPPAGRRLLPRRRLRPRARRRRHAGGCSRTTSARRRASPTCSRTASRWRAWCPSSSATTACARSTTTRSCCSPRCARSRRRRQRGDRRRLDARARPTRPTSSTRSSRARWASSWSRRRDLVVRDDVLYMRTTRGPAPRRTRSTAASTTTSSTRSSSAPTRCSACPGLVRAYRAGTVAIANAFGTGVADDKAVYHYVPEMIRFYLGEEPILDNVADLPAVRPRAARVRARRACDELVFKPTGESGGKGVFIGPATTERGARRRWPTSSARDPEQLDRAGGRERCRRCRPRCPTARSRRATSTCGRSRSSASRSASCPAA